nr:uncharacterized protein LOC119168713 [Rhipicephalus microplus]
MVLIPKPGKPPSIDNLRPISLTSCVGKVLEHVLLNRWQRYLEESNIYPHTMLGFRAKLCTQDAMLLLKNEIVDRHFPTLDNRAVLGLDLQGALDNVHHSAILRQVSHFNMGERTFAYVKDFLTNCTTRLVAGELQLPLKQLGSTGTPQGLYTIYADDITLWSTGGSDSHIEAALQEAVAAVEEQLRPTGLKCSPTKSELLVISPRSARRPTTQNINVVTQDGTPIPHVQTLRVLGLHLQDLNRNNVTVQKLNAKLSLATRLLKKVATRYQGMREDSLLRLTQSFAVSHISYVASFHNLKAAEKIKIDAMIRKPYKTALGLYPYTNTERMLALGVHNTLEEIAEAQRKAQYHRLSQTRTGRAILKRIGINAPATTPEFGPNKLFRSVADSLRPHHDYVTSGGGASRPMYRTFPSSRKPNPHCEEDTHLDQRASRRPQGQERDYGALPDNFRKFKVTVTTATTMATPAPTPATVVMQQPREPPTFHGSSCEEAETWLETHDRVAALN